MRSLTNNHTGTIIFEGRSFAPFSIIYFHMASRMHMKIEKIYQQFSTMSRSLFPCIISILNGNKIGCPFKSVSIPEQYSKNASRCLIQYYLVSLTVEYMHAQHTTHPLSYTVYMYIYLGIMRQMLVSGIEAEWEYGGDGLLGDKP